MLTLPLDKLAFIIEKAVAYDEPVPGELGRRCGDPAEDGEFGGGGAADSPACAALGAALSALAVDELADLVAIAWVGRGDFPCADWRAARCHALDALRRDECSDLIGLSLLADYLQQGAASLGLTVGEAIVAIH